MLSEQEKMPWKHRVFKALMSEAVGFEPTCPCGQLHFECSSLQPLRYASVYKYSLLGTNHMISSQPRYDHFDTSPYSMTAARDCFPTWILYTKEPVCQRLFPVRDYYEERLNYQSKCAADSETVLSDGISNNDDTGIKSKMSGNDIR